MFGRNREHYQIIYRKVQLSHSKFLTRKNNWVFEHLRFVGEFNIILL